MGILNMQIFRALAKIAASLDTHSSWMLPSLARAVFVLVLLVYFWKSALTKIGSGLFSPSVGAYAQIFPRTMEAVSYDPSQLNAFHTLVVLAGTYAEFILPFLIVVGLLARLAALGMIGFVLMQSVVDVVGHGLARSDIGSWLDGISGALILDQRAFWILALLVIVMKGAGPVSVDSFLVRKFQSSEH